MTLNNILKIKQNFCGSCKMFEVDDNPSIIEIERTYADNKEVRELEDLHRKNFGDISKQVC